MVETILGDHYTEDIDKQISAEIGKGFVARADFNSKNDELKTANDTIKGLQEAAKKFDGQDVEGLKTQLSTLQTKYDTDIAAVRKASAIDIALANSKAKNGKAARALLDLDAVKLDGNKLLGFDDQLEALKNPTRGFSKPTPQNRMTAPAYTSIPARNTDKAAVPNRLTA